MTLRESDIRPREIFERYLELSRIDAEAMDTSSFMEIPCPGCASRDVKLFFVKHRFSYKLCAECGSIFCSPRPDQETIDRFYRNSPSARFWAEVFFPTVQEARREKLVRPKIHRILSWLSEYEISCQRICDVGAGGGILLQELRKILPETEFGVIEPCTALAGRCRDLGLLVLEETVERSAAWHGRFDVVLSMEVMEHVMALDRFCVSMRNLLHPNGAAVITCLNGDGFDIAVLGEHSKSVSPPHHLNFLSLEGIRRLFLRCGFSDVILQTPGQLDVEIVLNSGHMPRFLDILARRDGAQSAFQQFLVDHRLSSHTWCLAFPNGMDSAI